MTNLVEFVENRKAELKRRLKHGPRLSRQLRASYALHLIDAPPRTLSPATLRKIKSEIGRLSRSDAPQVQRFVRSMRERYPQLRGEQ